MRGWVLIAALFAGCDYPIPPGGCDEETTTRSLTATTPTWTGEAPVQALQALMAASFRVTWSAGPAAGTTDVFALVGDAEFVDGQESEPVEPPEGSLNWCTAKRAGHRWDGLRLETADAGIVVALESLHIEASEAFELYQWGASGVPILSEARLANLGHDGPLTEPWFQAGTDPDRPDRWSLSADGQALYGCEAEPGGACGEVSFPLP